MDGLMDGLLACRMDEWMDASVDNNCIDYM